MRQELEGVQQGCQAAVSMMQITKAGQCEELVHQLERTRASYRKLRK